VRRVRLRGEVAVALPPERAMFLFTAAGERLWAPGWEPAFPAGEQEDAGSVFVTASGGVETFWVIVERGESSVRYARVAPGMSAGTVEVRLRADGDGTLAEVAYDLTALSEEGDEALAKLESGYDEFLGEWRDAIAAAVSTGRVP
jgi:hypothetical protein